MRPATTREIVRRHAAGHPPDTIAAQMHIGKQAVRDAIAEPASTPAPGPLVWATAATIASYAGAIRVNPDWVHQTTAALTRQELRTLLAVAVAMIDPDTTPREALAWADDGPRRGRPPKRP